MSNDNKSVVFVREYEVMQALPSCNIWVSQSANVEDALSNVVHVKQCCVLPRKRVVPIIRGL